MAAGDQSRFPHHHSSFAAEALVRLSRMRCGMIGSTDAAVMLRLERGGRTNWNSAADRSLALALLALAARTVVVGDRPAATVRKTVVGMNAAADNSVADVANAAKSCYTAALAPAATNFRIDSAFVVPFRPLPLTSRDVFSHCYQAHLTHMGAHTAASPASPDGEIVLDPVPAA